MVTAQKLVLYALVCGLAACGDDDSTPSPGVDAGIEPPSTLITLDDGQLEGEIDGTSRRFLGIPFARPPVGELRWKAPVPNDPWSGVLDATEFGGVCAQPPSLQSMESESE